MLERRFESWTFSLEIPRNAIWDIKLLAHHSDLAIHKYKYKYRGECNVILFKTSM